MVKLPSGTDMDINSNNRERSTFSSRMIFRSISIISNVSFYAYHIRIEHNNDFLENMVVDSINSSQLSYKDDFESEGNLVSKTTVPTPVKKS